MKRIVKFLPVHALALVVLALSACSSGDREQRLTQLRGKYGDAAPAVKVVAAPETAGARLWREKTCNTCHGNDGVHALLPNYPIVARQGQEYALQQMKDIQSGARHNGQTAAMKAVVQNVTEEEFTVLADFIANELGQGVPIGSAVVDESLPGAQLFKTKTCTACHGQDGKTPLLPTYPRIAGNPKDYIVQQMTDIKSGARDNSAAVKGMQGIMHLVTEEEIGQLAEYVSSLPR